ncbi:hypothetical protein Godav_007464 [Gossypium davidsonii]|uniref:MBD domain-containing protein n=2 Tax=Gossypium TaxID=3633 RepID=A0A7J8S774_GOSDV|nr:hypothetical protein [Gossypium davidsonii]MBA0657362.1 hypothetical protein [Gossypium klotzschianum]
MEDQTSDDWLPPGWKVEVRQRRNGKKDKCYYAPCGELRFISRAEVVRYLKKCGSKTEEKEKVPSKQSSKNVTVEKAEAEGLPPGWTKEVKITKKGNKVRRDPFYTDPVSGYVFRSMKDALRYVETGKLGKLAFKPKENESNEEDLEEDDICEPVIVESQKVALKGMTDEVEKQTAEHVSNSSGITKEEEMLNSASTGEQMSLSEHTPNQHKGLKLQSPKTPVNVVVLWVMDLIQFIFCTSAGVDAESSSLNLSEAKDSEQMGQKEESAHASGDAVGIGLDEHCRDDGMMNDETEKTQQGRSKTKLKKDVSAPRRASKRLAGVALDPTPEIKTRARRSSIKQLSEVLDGEENSSPGNRINRASKQLDLLESSLETSCALDASKSKEPILGTSNTVSSVDMLVVNGHVGNLETKTNAGEDKSVLPLGSRKLESDDKASGVPESLIDMPIADLWTDPCIAFAIQTLTGIPCDTPTISESNSGKNPVIQATPEARAEREGCGLDMPLTYPAIWKEHTGKVEKGHDMPESSLEMPLADIWADPCIEFAIKTLTGAIPVEYGLDNQHCFQQQPSSVPNQSVNHLTLPDVGLDKFSQTEFIRQQYDVTGKSMSKEHGIRNPIYNYSHHHHRSGERP